MSTITLRNTKGSALTFTEMDNNFSNLNTDKLENITGENLNDLSDVDTAGVADGNVLAYNNGTGNWEASAAAGGLSNVVEDTTPQLGGDLDVNGNSIVSNTNGNITIAPDGSGDIQLTPTSGNVDIDYATWPSADGSADQYLQTDGLGTLTWATITPGISDVVEDTTPQLGGDLDGQGNKVEDVELDNYKETVYTGGSTTGTITPDVANGNVQKISLTGNITFNAFANAEAGQSMTLIIDTNGTGRTLTSTMLFAGGSKTLSTTDTTDVMTVFYDGTTYYASLATNFS